MTEISSLPGILIMPGARKVFNKVMLLRESMVTEVRYFPILGVRAGHTANRVVFSGTVNELNDRNKFSTRHFHYARCT